MLYRWKQPYGALELSEVKELKAQREENAHLRLTLDRVGLQPAAKGTARVASGGFQPDALSRPPWKEPPSPTKRADWRPGRLCGHPLPPQISPPPPAVILQSSFGYPSVVALFLLIINSLTQINRRITEGYL